MVKDYNSRASNNSQEDKNRREKGHGLIVVYRYRAIIVLVLLLLVFLLWAAWSMPKPAVECVTFEYEDSELTSKEIPYEAPFLVPDQVIVIGPISAVNGVVENVRADSTLNLEPIRKCDFHYLDPNKERNA